MTKSITKSMTMNISMKVALSSLLGKNKKVVKRGKEYHGCREEYIVEKGKRKAISYSI